VSYSRQEIAANLRRTGYPDLADQAERELPEHMDIDQLMSFAQTHGVSRDDVISAMGGSP
jgi:hypothetical protein